MYRETFAMVDVRAIEENVAAVKLLLLPDTQLLAAVKANGYGHGAKEAARAAIRGGATFLGVASVEEGLALRNDGIDAPILVLGAITYEAARAASQHGLSVTVTPDCVDWPETPFSTALRVHVKVDTGMTRIGARTTDDVRRVAAWVRNRADLVCEGVFTHLACADAASLQHAEQQLEKFQGALSVLRDEGISPRLIHASNSAGALRRPDWQFNMVRIGIAAYGYAPSQEFTMPVHLHPALNLYSLITRISTIEAGETVGYGAKFTAVRKTRVATVPVGYADGYSRLLSNRAHVVIRGIEAPVIGNVCMDQTMIDVTDVPGAMNGDCVTLYGHHAPDDWNRQSFGEFGDDHDALTEWLTKTYEIHARKKEILSVDKLAENMGTISYEVMCALAPRVPRIFAL